MQDFKLLSALLCYPEQELIDALPHIRQVVAQNASLQTGLTPLLDYLGSHDLIRLQENYVANIDRNQRHSLHLFEHILLEEYRKHGFELNGNELLRTAFPGSSWRNLRPTMLKNFLAMRFMCLPCWATSSRLVTVRITAFSM